jgi:hypothetical protein
MASLNPTRVPRHLWVVGVISLLWNGFGAFDYIMSVSHNAAYLAQFPPGLAELMDSFPAWATAGWAVGVWASLIGSILLLMRSRHAATAFVISLIGALISFFYQFAVLDVPPGLERVVSPIMPLVIVVAIVAQWLYARRMTNAGVLH